MPLARIVTRLAEDTDALAKDLRARGFEVVTKSPDEISSEPADLEITVEECAFDEALTSASAIARTQDKCVFIAPGAITENPRPASLIALRREPELPPDLIQHVDSDSIEQRAAIHQLVNRPETSEQISVPPAELVVDLSAPVVPAEVSGLPEVISDSELAASLPAPLAEPLSETGEPFTEEDVVLPREYSEESLSTPISEPVSEAPLAASEIEEYWETAPEEVIDVPAIVEPEAVSLAEAEAISPAPETVAEIPAAVELEPEPVSLMEVQVIETQPELIAGAPAGMEPDAVPLAQIEVVSETLPQSLPETTPAILQEDFSLVKTEPTSDWPIWHPLAEPEIAAQNAPLPTSPVKEPAFAVPLASRAKAVFKDQSPQVVPLMQNAVPVRPNTYRQKILQKQVLQNDEVFWKTATVLAMVAVAALLVGAAANRFSPLPANVMQRSIEAQQPVPFEKARIIPALPLDAKIGTGELPSTRGSDVVRLHPALAVEPAAPRIVPESDDRSNQRLVRVKPRSTAPRPPSATHHPAGPAESDMVAEDTVVRFNKRPAAPHSQAQKNAGVKQYTDLD
jgi:hypothetical protein